LYHWQIANPAFFDKDERWYDEYEKKEVEKIGIIKKLFQRLKKIKLERLRQKINFNIL
jgi:hypothetical protein